MADWVDKLLPAADHVHELIFEEQNGCPKTVAAGPSRRNP